jgi:hypothetical protein
MASRLRIVRRVSALALLALLLPLGARASSAVQQSTVLHTYVAFQAGKLAPDLRVRASVPGSCWTVSAVESHAYSWRCSHGNYIHDPCFSASRTSRFVVCPDAPWSDRVLLLNLTERLPPWRIYKRTVSESAWPWGIVTVGGKRCITAAAAATGEVAGKQVTFVCAGGGLLAGFTRRSTRTWTIWYAPAWDSKRLTLVSITDVWLR